MIDISINVDPMKKALADFYRDVEMATAAAMHDALTAAEEMARQRIKAQTKTRTGALLAGLTTEQQSATQGRFLATAKHSIFIEGGTRAHRITASVWHPGTKARPFRAAASLFGGSVLQRGLQARVDGLAYRFAA